MQLSDPTLIKTQAYIDGRWCDADSGARHLVRDPANGQVICEVAALGATETRRAIDAAVVAQRSWKQRSGKQRGALLRKWYELILAHQEDLARLLSWEQGKPLAESRGEILYGASFVEWFAEEAKRLYGEVIPHVKSDTRLLVLRQPVGVVAAITPWNFPNAMVTRKLAPALASGCSVVLKPAPETPLSALALAELGARAGLPAGLINVVTGPDAVAIGGELTAHPAVRKLSFTGSTAVGKLLMAQCAGTVKKLSLELGGNAPFLVFDDADLDAAVSGAIAAKFRNSGQTCVCTNRLLVQDGIYPQFVARFTAAVEQLRVGPATDEQSQQGPLINERALTKLRDHIADALAQGAQLRSGGKPHALGGGFFEPTVLTEVSPSMRCAREETFGPLAAIMRFATEQQAVALANDTPFGLAAYVYTRDLGRAFRVGEALEAGMVGINEGLISTEVAPFGGIKESGLGREGSHHGIDEYTELKYLCVGIGGASP